MIRTIVDRVIEIKRRHKYVTSFLSALGDAWLAALGGLFISLPIVLISMAVGQKIIGMENSERDVYLLATILTSTMFQMMWHLILHSVLTRIDDAIDTYLDGVLKHDH